MFLRSNWQQVTGSDNDLVSLGQNELNFVFDACVNQQNTQHRKLNSFFFFY